MPLAFAQKDPNSNSTNAHPAFLFTSLARDSGTKHMADTLQQAAAKHKLTAGHELAVVLPDPVGYAAELNALRLVAERSGLQLSPEKQHKLQSHFLLQGLANNVADMRALNNVAPILSKASFDAMLQSSPTRMQGATWEPLDVCLRPTPQQMGRMWTAQARQNFAQQAPEFKALAKKEIEKGYDPAASLAWVKRLEEQTRQALEPYEKDWLHGRDQAAVGRYFAQHFDDTEPNRPGTVQDHSAGRAYMWEAELIDGPPPTASAVLLEAYAAAYQRNIEDPQAFLVRAMVANQRDLFGALATHLAGDPNGESPGMRDKSVDFIKGLLDVKGGHYRVKFGWLTNPTLGFAIGPMTALSSAALSHLASTLPPSKRQKIAALAMNVATWFSGVNTALQTAMTQKVVRPVLVYGWVEEGTVNKAILGAAGEIEGWQGARPGGKQLRVMLTDTGRLSKGPTDLQALLAGGDGVQVAKGGKAGAALAAQATGAIVLDAATGLSPEQGTALFRHQVEEARKISGSVRAAIPQGGKALAMSIDGRLALASVIVQTIGIINGSQAVEKAERDLAKATNPGDRADKEAQLRNARLGYMDSIGGLVAGSLDSLRVAGEAMNLQRGAAAGNVAINSIYALKFGAQMAGVFGGTLNAYVSWLKADEADRNGQSAVAGLHIGAALAFGGTGATSLVGASLTSAQFIVERQVGTVAVQQAAQRFAATRVASVALGTAVPVVGWVLLGVGIVASVGAALLEPTRLEGWARQTPFGKGPVGHKFKTLEQQETALYEALGLAVKTEAQEAQTA